jgi:hypothetical protein
MPASAITYLELITRRLAGAGEAPRAIELSTLRAMALQNVDDARDPLRAMAEINARLSQLSGHPKCAALRPRLWALKDDLVQRVVALALGRPTLLH